MHRYYAFDAAQNGGTLRIIVLDNSAGSLEASDPGQTAWLTTQLQSASTAHIPVVAIASEPLRNSDDGNAISTMLANAGVLAVFTGNPDQLDELHMVPDSGSPQIPEYEGASLGYQQAANDGVLWYDVSVNTSTRQLSVDAVPVISSLSIKPLAGLSVARSFTLQFQAIARRPPGSLPPTSSDSDPGIANYVCIPAPSCGSRPCIQPTYRFTSSDPTIGAFVQPSGPGSPFPALNASGQPTDSSTSGLFCAFNTGTTTVSVTTGLLTSRLRSPCSRGASARPAERSRTSRVRTWSRSRASRSSGGRAMRPVARRRLLLRWPPSRSAPISQRSRYLRRHRHPRRRRSSLRP